jgi:hypothetical protein
VAGTGVAVVGGLTTVVGVSAATGIDPLQRDAQGNYPAQPQEERHASPESGAIVIALGLSLLVIGGAMYGLGSASAPPAPERTPAAAECAGACTGQLHCNAFSANECPLTYGCALNGSLCSGEIWCRGITDDLSCSAHGCAWQSSCE